MIAALTITLGVKAIVGIIFAVCLVGIIIGWVSCEEWNKEEWERKDCL